MLHLNFSRSEIRDALQTYTNDRLMWRLIGGDDEGAGLRPHETMILNMLRSTAEQNPAIYQTVAVMIATLAQPYGIDLSESVRRINKQEKKK